jgi:BlaI family transcriptional regulator, penicillinase repressor
MATPDGKLTPVQHSIMQMAWDAGEIGVTVTGVWSRMDASRSIARTTAQNLLDRLVERRWLKRMKREDGIHYVAAVSKVATEKGIASEFLDDYFDGSASKLVMSLLGAKRLRKEDIEYLRSILDKNPPGSK